MFSSNGAIPTSALTAARATTCALEAAPPTADIDTQERVLLDCLHSWGPAYATTPLQPRNYFSGLAKAVEDALPSPAARMERLGQLLQSARATLPDTNALMPWLQQFPASVGDGELGRAAVAALSALPSDPATVTLRENMATQYVSLLASSLGSMDAELAPMFMDMLGVGLASNLAATQA